MNHKVGDIIYFKSTYKARYSKKGGTYEYHFKPGDRYRINHLYGGDTGDITNLEDGTNHFAHSSHWEIIVSSREWRDIKLNKLLN